MRYHLQRILLKEGELMVDNLRWSANLWLGFPFIVNSIYLQENSNKTKALCDSDWQLQAQKYTNRNLHGGLLTNHFPGCTVLARQSKLKRNIVFEVLPAVKSKAFWQYFRCSFLSNVLQSILHW